MLLAILVPVLRGGKGLLVRRCPSGGRSALGRHQFQEIQRDSASFRRLRIRLPPQSDEARRPQSRVSEKCAGPEFEDPTRSGCCRQRQPLPVSRWPAPRNVPGSAADRTAGGTGTQPRSPDPSATRLRPTPLARTAQKRTPACIELRCRGRGRVAGDASPPGAPTQARTTGAGRDTTGDCFPPRKLAVAVTPDWDVRDRASIRWAHARPLDSTASSPDAFAGDAAGWTLRARLNEIAGTCPLEMSVMRVAFQKNQLVA